MAVEGRKSKADLQLLTASDFAESLGLWEVNVFKALRRWSPEWKGLKHPRFRRLLAHAMLTGGVPLVEDVDREAPPTPSRTLAMRRDAVKRLQASGANRGVTRILSENVTTQRRSSSFVRGVATRLRTKAVFVLRASYTTRHITIPLLMRCRYSKARSSKRCFDLARRTRRRL